MEERLETVLAWLESAIQTTGDFLSEQTPLVIREILLYYRAYYTIIMAIEVLIGIVCTIWWMRKWKSWLVWMREEECPHLGLFVAAAGVVGWGTAIFNISPVLKVWFTPRLFLLEWAKRFF